MTELGRQTAGKLLVLMVWIWISRGKLTRCKNHGAGVCLKWIIFKQYNKYNLDPKMVRKLSTAEKQLTLNH